LLRVVIFQEEMDVVERAFMVENFQMKTSG